ncbi:BAT2 N-terminus family protein [Acanthocheilonema viteae]
MSSARGAAGAVKPKLHNVNSIYAGKNQNAVKAPGAGKHGGLQSLGKTTAVVRRMPPPATLPSLRAESQGQDPNIALVPHGGTGWAKGDASAANGQTDFQSVVKSSASLTGSTSTTTATLSTLSGINSGNGPHTTDLRPKWAKQPNVAEAQAAALQNASAVTASSRDFPSLAAATAAIAKQSSNALTESLKPQKSGSWRAGGSSAVSRNEGDMPQVTLHSHSGPSYLSTTVTARIADRQLPSRYYDTTAVPPPPPPNGTFQVPKLQSAISVSNSGPLETLSSQPLSAENAPTRKTSCPSTTSVSSVTSQYPANVAVPPPNYSRPPPNYVPAQTDSARSGLNYGAHLQPSEDGTDGKQVQPKSGLGDEGCNNRRYLEKVKDCVMLEPAQITVSSDIQSNYTRRVMCDSRGDFDEFTSRGKSEWHDEETHRWLSAIGCPAQESQQCAEFSQNGYTRDRDEELGRRQNIEREAAIERSRQKRRMASQSSALSESEGGSAPSGYGSVRMMNAYENDSYPDWDQSSRGSFVLQKNNDDSGVRECWGVMGGYDVSTRRDEQETTQRIEFRMLKRPEGKGDVAQQLSQMGVQDSETHDEDEELQLTKLSRPAAKIVKRMAPGSIPPVEEANNQSSETTNSQTQRKPIQQQKNTDKRANDSRIQSSLQGHQQKTLFHREIDGTPSNEWAAQKQKTSLGNTSQQSHTPTKTREDGVEGAHVTSVPSMLMAPPPADNVWEKRAEERESAERERAAQQDALNQMHLQQQFPTVGEQSGISTNEPLDDLSIGRSENSYSKNEHQHGRRSGNRSRNRDSHKWTEKKCNYSQQHDEVCVQDYYVAEEEEDGNGGTEGSGGLFHGQREFVNSRVHRSGRGSSSVSSRGSRTYGCGSFLGIRRGGSMPHQHLGTGQAHRTQNRCDRNQRRGKCQELQKDNFSNMGEFRVEDTYVNAPVVKEPLAEEKTEDKVSGDPVTVQDHERHVQSRNISRQGGSHRSAQQLYEPKKRQEYSRTGRRGTRAGPTKINSQRNGDVRTTGAYQNPPERGKRKKTNEERKVVDDESSSRTHGDGSYRRGGIRGTHSIRRRRHSGVRQGNARGNNQSYCSGTERTAQLKSPVTSEGHEEWETASESSDFADRQKQVRRQNASSKYGNSRRTIRSSNGRRESGIGAVPNRTSSNSKNVKPASTTSHVATRGAQLAKEETAPITQGEAARRPDTCKDGLAGVDINNAGVIVIDDRPDGQVDDATENNDDFEEVLSKKSRKLRQQQINEQLEAEERRKSKEKEKIERRKARVQAKRIGKRSAAKNDRIGPNGANLANEVAPKTTALNTNNHGVRDAGGGMNRPILTNAQNTLNTTVWNSSIVREQTTHPSPPVENHPVIPSPIARPTPKARISSASVVNTAVKKEVDLWTESDGEQRLHAARKLSDGTVKKNAEFTTNFNAANTTHGENGQYQFTFDSSLQDNTQSLKRSSKEALVTKGDGASPLTNIALEANDDECLKQRLDKVKDFWPGQQQFANNLLGSGNESTTIAPLVNDKSGSTNVGVSSVAHGPNVAKVRPQPQASEQIANSATVNLKEANSSTPFVPLLPPPSPIACLPPGAYLQSLTQVPPPAPFPHYSMVFSESYNPNSSTTSPAQTLIGNAIPASQTQTTRSRPGSFVEQSQLFIHPPPSGATGNSMTWSNANPQIELLAGINATPPLASQPVSSVQRFQVSSPRSASAFGPVPSVLSSNAKIPHMGRPPPHPHQVPPPLHPPHNFMAPPPDFVSLQGTSLGAVGSQRSGETHPTTNNPLSRNTNGTIGQIPHLQQSLNFSQASQTGYSVSAAATFNQAPQLHAFTAPPPPIRYPALPQLASNDANGVVTAGWTRAPALSFKYTNSAVLPASRPPLSRYQSSDRWTVPVSLPVQYLSTQNYQHQNANKDSSDTVIHGNIDRFQGTHVNSTRGATPEENSVRASSVSSISASGTTAESLDSSNRQKKAAKV